MSEEFIHVHCSKCNRSIRAPRAAAGRYGKCPSCHNPIYVPSPDDELEEIPLAPLETDSQRSESEARRIEAEILRERAEGAATGKPSAGPAPAQKPAASPAGAPEQSVQITDAIIDYLLAMKNSELDNAQRLASRLAKVRAQTHSRIQQLMVDAMPPPKLRDLPQGLYLGFLKKLDEALGEDD